MSSSSSSVVVRVLAQLPSGVLGDSLTRHCAASDVLSLLALSRDVWSAHRTLRVQLRSAAVERFEHVVADEQQLDVLRYAIREACHSATSVRTRMLNSTAPAGSSSASLGVDSAAPQTHASSSSAGVHSHSSSNSMSASASASVAVAHAKLSVNTGHGAHAAAGAPAAAAAAASSSSLPVALGGSGLANKRVRRSKQLTSAHLTYAVMKAPPAALRVLLEESREGRAPSFDPNQIMAASDVGRADIVQLLCDAGVRPNEDAVLKAAQNNHADVLRVLLKAGAPVLTSNYEALRKFCSMSALDAMAAAARAGHHDVVRVFLEFNVTVHPWTVGYAAERGDRAMLEMLMPVAVELDTDTINRAVHSGHKSVVEYLLSQNAPVDAKALVYACGRGHRDVCRLLLEHRVQFTDEALVAAIKRQHTDVVDLLVNDYHVPVCEDARRAAASSSSLRKILGMS